MTRRPHPPKDPIPREGLRPRFWERVPLRNMAPKEWEALCDGCGKCCLNKLEDPDTGEVVFTRIGCRLLDDETCRCGNYEIRKTIVPECVVLTPGNIGEIAYWMPRTCAYRLLHEGKSLYDWHPLISGDPDSVHRAGESVQGWTVPEFEVPEDDWEDYIVEGDL
ncbi:YcgN family cysteine cluster protein [Acidimangrovimonas sediminis]|uniref:YcgN family cysteine cluster protein n=1 Tax=Acidimangrovimonas sediminis TaxID=2056283 RepID=UPI000C7FA9C8|nr:YcgN family cysteine cluster protein [Acidimangrovimonas sediminis]